MFLPRNGAVGFTEDRARTSKGDDGFTQLPAAPVSDSSRLWKEPEGPEGQAAVPVGGGRAWPGFEPTRRAKLAARTASGRAAAHGHTEQPGPARHTKQHGLAGTRARQRGGYRSTRPLVGSLSHCLVEAQAE